jgi:hypothetical protein
VVSDQPPAWQLGVVGLALLAIVLCEGAGPDARELGNLAENDDMPLSDR